MRAALSCAAAMLTYCRSYLWPRAPHGAPLKIGEADWGVRDPPGKVRQARSGGSRRDITASMDAGV